MKFLPSTSSSSWGFSFTSKIYSSGSFSLVSLVFGGATFCSASVDSSVSSTISGTSTPCGFGIFWLRSSGFSSCKVD